jgi:acyl-CoA synthetase (NDP forming)
MAIAWLAGEQTLAARRELRKSGFAVCESARILARALAAAGRRPAPGLELVAPGSTAGTLGGPPSEALRRLAECGAPVAPMARAGDAAATATAAAELGFPVVIKTDSERIAHKTELSGVIPGVADADAAAAAFAALDANGIAADGVLVQAQVSGSRELLMALRADPIFGLVLAIGIGGVLTEALEKAVIVLPAFTPEAIEEGVRRAGLEALFGPYRGAAAVDLEALGRIAGALLELGKELGPDLAHLELNPVIVDQAGAPWLVDALVDIERKDP